jgi:iron complex outermembrane receptor protein
MIPSNTRPCAHFFGLAGYLIRSALFLLCGTLVSLAAEGKREFDIPSGSADVTLKAFSAQSGVELLYSSEAASGVVTQAVKGGMSPQEAVERMLRGTPLQALVDTKSGVVRIARISKEPGKEKNEASRRPKAAADSETGSAVVAGLTPATTAGGAAEKSEDKDIVILSPFTVAASQAEDRYQPTEATSGGRVKVNLFDSTQSVSVIGGEVLRDVAAGRILDAMKFVPGVSESSLPNGLDRITIRGFLTTLRTLDGVTSTSQANIDPFIIERIEIVKGPSAILAPAGVPGGTINNVSKKPVFRDFTSVGVEVGRFDSSRVEFDLNRRAYGGKVAVRVLAASQHGDDYWNMPKDFFVVAPMATWRFSPTTQLTWQTHYINWKIGNYNGIAIDPSVGTTSKAVIYQGVPRNLNIYGPDSYRQDDRVENTLTFLSTLSDSLALRVLARHGNQYNENNNGTTLAGGATSAGTNNNSFDPLTGNYTPGIVYATTAPYATTPVTISRTYNRSGSLTDQSSLRYTLQADLVHTLKRDSWSAETLVGYAYNNDRGHDIRFATTAPAITLENFVYAADVYGALSRRQFFHNLTQQVFVNERVTLWRDRLIVTGGVSRNQWDLEVDDQFANRLIKAKPKATLKTYGAVLKPIENVALFYSYAENAAPLPVANIAAGGPATQEGVQNEGGVRVKLRDGRIRLSASYYDIQQSNTNVPNPANFAFPPPVPALPGLLADRSAEGWEFEAQGSLTESLSVIAAYTKYKNRNPFGQEFRGAAEQAWSVLGNYRFDKRSALAGLSVSLSADYLSKRAGDDASGFTVTGVPRKPTFYLPERTLVNLALSYRYSRNWSAQLNVDNVFNTEYLTSTLSRGIVWPGTPTNAKLRFTYEF